MLSLLREGKFERVMTSQVAGTGDTLNSSIVDMQGYDSILVVGILGDVTVNATLAMKAYVGDNSALSDGAYSTNYASKTASATDCDNKLLIVSNIKVTKRYLRVDILRGVANAVIDGVIVIKYNAKNIGVTQGTDVVANATNIG